MINTCSKNWYVRFITDFNDSSHMTDMDPLQMQIDMLKAQSEAQKNMYRQMYASDPEMAEHLCSQLDQTLQMQIDMITGLNNAVRPSEPMDPIAQAEAVMKQLGYDEDQIEGVLGSDDYDSITAEALSGIDPSEFTYGTIVDLVSVIDRFPEGPSAPVDEEGLRRFGILCSGIVSAINDHSLETLDVEPRDAENRSLVAGILSDYWGVEGRGDLIGTLQHLIVSGHTMDFVDNLKAISQGKSSEDLHTEDMDEGDAIVFDARFEFTRAFAGHIDPVMLRGWDLGRAANVTRWGYFAGYITEDEAWGILEQIADSCMEHFDSWRSFAQSYLFGGMYWKCPWGPDECLAYAGQVLAAAEYLLCEGEWKDFPWASGRS